MIQFRMQSGRRSGDVLAKFKFSNSSISWSTTITFPRPRHIATFRNGVLIGSNSYNVAGQLVSSTDALTITTSILETRNGNAETVRTTTYPDGTRIETFYQDGQLKSIAGTAVHGVRYDYGTANNLTYVTETCLQTNGTDTAESVTTYSDMVGHTVSIAYSGGHASSNFFNGKGQLWKQIDPDGVVTLFAYNGRGELETTAVDMDRDDVIDYGGTDRITRSQSEAASAHSTIVRRTTTSVWGTDNADSAEAVLINEISVSGLQSWQVRFGLTNSTVMGYDRANARRSVTITNPDSSYSLIKYANGRVEWKERGQPLS